MNVTTSDALGILKACFALAPFLFAPGYASGWALNLFEFRQRRFLLRLALAVPLSIAICPMLSYLFARFLPAGLWTFFALTTFSSTILLAKEIRRTKFSSLSRHVRIVSVLAMLWAVGAIATLIDLQIGDKLFLPISTYDHSTRVAIMGAISRHVPPKNPFFAHPAVPLRYHYLWMLLCGLPARMFHLSAAHLMYAGIIWCGLGLMCTVALGLRFLMNDQRFIERKAVLGVALLCVTGLDILPTLYLNIHRRFWIADLEWWNTTQITSWAASLLWVPHHTAALLACFVGFLLLRHASGSTLRRSMIATVSAGFFFASAAGLSIYVAFTFALAIALWLIALIAQRRWRELTLFAASGVVATLCAAPFLLSLGAPAAGTKFAEIAVRPFPLGIYFAEKLGFKFHSLRSLTVGNFLLLPVNYALELGFFLAVAIARFRQIVHRKLLANANELAAWTLVLASFLVGTFLRSSTISVNDLGFRCFLPAQLVLLLWGATMLAEWWLARTAKRTATHPLALATMATLLIVGVLGTTYEVFMIRMTPILYDRWAIPGLQGYDADRQAAQRTYALRSAYAALNAQLPPSAIIQNNPATQNFIPHQLYSGHDAVAAALDCGAPLGGDPSVCEQRVRKLVALFLPGYSDVESTCREYGIDVILAQDTDPAWHDASSWIWTRTPIVANNFVRAFRCGLSDNAFNTAPKGAKR